MPRPIPGHVETPHTPSAKPLRNPTFADAIEREDLRTIRVIERDHWFATMLEEIGGEATEADLTDPERKSLAMIP